MQRPGLFDRANDRGNGGSAWRYRGGHNWDSRRRNMNAARRTASRANSLRVRPVCARAWSRSRPSASSRRIV